MAIPLIYNLRSLRARWTSTIVAVLGIAGTVGVFIAMLSLARGFEATLVASGSAGNAIVRRAGATSEMDSSDRARPGPRHRRCAGRRAREMWGSRQPGSRRGGGIPAEKHGNRRERAGARRLAEGSRGAGFDADRRRSVL